MDALLATGWPQDALERALTADPLPEPGEIRTTTAAVITGRLEALSATPAPIPAQAIPMLPTQRNRTIQQEADRRVMHECPGRPGEEFCGNHVMSAGALCPTCKTASMTPA
jgi:hypothetical protein